ncbi:NERD domain-containing protein [Methylobacterium sp. Leaf466]|uniref:NERD domain-containing protein n=1 Tax=Methylobacterium sp. Leaf466 TaxID=1736386 RepID=UPI0009E76498|nr:NERD domain-containing protein [Methylobacterium sp. Leaf466]
MHNKDLTPLTARPENEIFDDLKKLCCSAGYIHAIAYFCWRDNLIKYFGQEITENDLQSQYSPNRLLTTEISTLIGLVLKEDIDPSTPHPKIVRNYIEESEALLHEIHLSMQKPWTKAFQSISGNLDNMDRSDPFSTAQGLREPIFYSGESAYNFQYENIARLKYSCDNEWLRINFGFTIDEACVVFKAIGKQQIQKMKANQITTTLQSKYVDSCLHCFFISLEYLEKSTGINSQTIECVINAFCSDRKKRNAAFSSISAFNEANSTPIIKLSDNYYISFQHYSLLEALSETPFFWMGSDKSYSATAFRNRGYFAEKFLADRLSHVFGAQNVYQNVNIYKGKNRFAEIDVLVIYGSRAIVAQTKSKCLTIEARKGNDQQLKSDFKKAIREAYDQALACSSAILDGEYKLISNSGSEIILEERPTIIFPFCILSDHYPALAMQARQFLNIDTNEFIRPPIVSDIFFMDTLSEILDNPLEFLNYLTLRTRFNENIVISNEIVALGYHLKHNLWLEDKYNLVNLADDFASCVDIAMSARRLGIPGDKNPNAILTRFENTPIGKLLSEIQLSAAPQLVDLGMLLLQTSSDAASHINNGLNKIIKSALFNNTSHDLSVPSEIDKSGFTIHVNAHSDLSAQEILSLHCRLRKYDTKSDSWYGVLLSPGSGAIRRIFAIKEKWNIDADMEKALKSWARVPMVPLSTLSANLQRHKVGRNERCPCGSGRKYKNCCLN